MKINWFNISTIIVSLVALFFSFLSWQVSKQSLDYEVNKDSALNTPAISETIDSTKITFKLNNTSELQSLYVVFPESISTEGINIMAKPLELYKTRLENLAKLYLSKKLIVKDSTATIGTFSIPVIVNYSAIVYGQSQNLRENRLFIFNIYYYNNVENVEYNNSFLINRCGYPLKPHNFYTGPFSDELDEKVFKQDKKDVQELLEYQLKDITKNLKFRMTRPEKSL